MVSELQEMYDNCNKHLAGLGAVISVEIYQFNFVSSYPFE